MVLAIIGESCTGKSTLVEELKKHINFTEYTGKDYTRLASSEAMAKLKFKKLLQETDEPIIYVITEKELLDFLPKKAKKVVITESLDVIKDRFKQRMHGNLPKPVEMMLEKKHGMFDTLDCDLLIQGSNLKENTQKVLELLQ